MKQILLKGAGYSGRGVRIRILTPKQIDQIREEAAHAIPTGEDATPEAKQAVYANEQKRIGIPAMVVEVTEKGGFTKQDDLLQATWKKASDLSVFTTKDLDALGDLFFKLHMAQAKEVEDILGEALDVTEA